MQQMMFLRLNTAVALVRSGNLGKKWTDHVLFLKSGYNGFFDKNCFYEKQAGNLGD